MNPGVIFLMTAYYIVVRENNFMNCTSNGFEYLITFRQVFINCKQTNNYLPLFSLAIKVLYKHFNLE